MIKSIEGKAEHRWCDYRATNELTFLFSYSATVCQQSYRQTNFPTSDYTTTNRDLDIELAVKCEVRFRKRKCNKKDMSVLYTSLIDF